MLDWSRIDTVLLDMDGTLLDLHFDNHFWLELVPEHYAAQHAISVAAAKEELYARFGRMAGRLEWYCLDFWGRELAIDIMALKREIAHLISLRPYAAEFLHSLRDAGKQVIMITNAHRDSLSLKMEKLQLEPYFDRLISSHDYGYPKEHPAFWQALEQDIALDKTRALFVDDSLPILRAGRLYGIAELLAIHAPDSRQGPKDTEEFRAIEHFSQLLPVEHA